MVGAGAGAEVVAGLVVVAGADVGGTGAEEDAGGGVPDAVAGKLGTVTYRFKCTHKTKYSREKLMMTHLGTGVEGRSRDSVVVRRLGLVAVDVDGHWNRNSVTSSFLEQIRGAHIRRRWHRSLLGR